MCSTVERLDRRSSDQRCDPSRSVDQLGRDSQIVTRPPDAPLDDSTGRLSVSPHWAAVRSSCDPLRAKVDVLRRHPAGPGIFTRTLRISSVIPSLKYSLSPSGLMSANGSTAIDGRGSSERSVENEAWFRRRRRSLPRQSGADCRPTHHAPATRAPTPASAISPAGQRLDAGRETIASISPGAASPVFCMPSGVTSNAQARTRSRRGTPEAGAQRYTSGTHQAD